MVDGADSVNGSGQRVIVPALNLNTNAVTITACVKGHQNADWAGIVFSRAGNTAAGIISNGGKLRYIWDNGHYTWDSTLAIPTDQSAYLALAISSGQAVGYVNGGASTNADSHVSEQFDGETSFGLDPYDTSVRRWIGVIDEVRLSKTTRSAGWLWAEWMNMASNATFNSYGPVQEAGSAVVDAYGIPDWWKIQYFGSTTGPNTGALDDWDHDGMSNYGEWKAGTCPTNALSLLTILDWRMGLSSDVVLVWSSVSGKYYTIQGTTNLMSGFVEAASNHIPATPGTNSCTLPVGQEVKKYYRVVVE